MNKGFLVVDTIEGAIKKKPNYPLLDGDLLVEKSDGTFIKECPGIAIGGIELTEEQKSRLREVSFTRYGLNYKIVEKD